MITVNNIFLDTEGKAFRVLWVSPDGTYLYFYDLESEKFPQKMFTEDLESQIAEGVYTIAKEDVFLNMTHEKDIPEKDILQRNMIWEKLKDLLSPENEPDIYERALRGKLFDECAESAGYTKKMLYIYIRRYWRCGKNKNAFLPNHTKEGGRGTKKHSDKKLGRPNKYGLSTGVYIDENIENIFEKAIKKYYHTKAEHSFKAVYELMVRDNFSHEKIDADGKKGLELFETDKIPTMRQFRYWYSKRYLQDETLKYRKGESKFNLMHRAVIGKTDTFIMGPGAKYQIDATVGDIYLVSQFNRSDIIGRPIIYFVIDTFSRMVVGMYVGLEGPSWLGAMMALANAATDKVKFCKEYGVDIAQEDWPCYHMPSAILGDRGEMESKAVDTLINAFGVRIENAPPYRADIKGIVEQYFHTVNTTVTAFLPGNVKPDMGERTGRDYRLDAKLDINQFTKVIIECVLYHNNEHYMESYERNEEMIADNVTPIPINLWNWGITHCSGLLQRYSEEKVKLCLMPTDTAMVTSKGIRFKGVYYICNRAIDEKWCETARAKGNFKVNISYDSRNMSNIYIRNREDNSFEVCVLTDWQEKYNNKCLEEIIYLQESEKIDKKKASRRKLTARVNLSSKVESIVAEAEKQAKQTPISKSKAERTGNIRENRKQEKEVLRAKEKFDLSDNVKAGQLEPVAEEDRESSLYLDLIERNAKERKYD